MNKFFAYIFVTISIVGFCFYKNSFIDFDKIAEESELKGRTFNNKPTEFITPAGIKVWLLEDRSVDLISVSFSFNRAGTAYDDEDKKGVSLITAQMLDGGTKDYDYKAYHDLLDINGIYIGFGTDNDYFNGFMTSPTINIHSNETNISTSNNKKLAFDILKKVLYEPRLDESFLKTLQKQFEVLVKTQKENPKTELSLQFTKELFKNHPYSRTIDEMAEDVASLEVSDIKNFITGSFVKDNLIISVAGNISKDELIDYIDEVFGSLEQTNGRVQLNKPDIDYSSEPVIIQRDTAQVISSFALEGVKRTDSNFYPLYIANHIFGGSGLTSRISVASREKEGLTYGIYTYLDAEELAPLIIGGFSCVPENYEKVKKILKKQMKKFASKGVTKKELLNAKKYLLASYNLRFKSTLELSKMLTQMQKYKLGLDFLQKRNNYVENVTLAEVNKAAAQYYNKQPKEVVIGTIK